MSRQKLSGKPPSTTPKWPTLNWKELKTLVEGYREELAEAGAQGLHLERVIVPARERFPGGFIKSEWSLRLVGRKREVSVVFSARPRHPYIVLIPGKGPRAAEAGSRSAFDLSLGKHLKGAKFLDLSAYPRERACVLWFKAEEKLGLVLWLIPAAPEAILIRENGDVLSRSRVSARDETRFTAPDGAKAPDDLEIRHELVASPPAYLKAVEAALDREAFDLRWAALEKEVRHALKHARERRRQSEVAAAEASAEADWQKYGELLKANLHDVPPIGADGARALTDYESGGTLRVPCDRKLTPQAQVERFFHMARRKGSRREQALSRVATFDETIARLERVLAERPAEGDWAALERLERASGAAPAPATKAEGKRKSVGGGWLGRAFVSKDGLRIWVGKSRDENLELTFKHARGNDMWMHVRGRPGAHVLIPVPSGKSVPLETLLDAAALCIFYSGGQSWGKTEVDYTFKKYVKRIRDSTEASYTHNKTLIVEPDPARLKRLLDAGS